MDDIEHIQIAIADYQPHPRNYNGHPDPQVGEIAESLRVFGQVKPVVVWREWYIAGHGVVLGAQRLGWTHLKAERLPADWPEYKALAYLAADNELARGASPNLTALAALAKEVQAEDAGMGRLAAGGEEGLRRLAEWMKEPAGEDVGPQIDRAEELREKWGVEAGQLWQLGEHRLICGDCTDAAVVARVMGGERAQLCFTSPPYAEQRKEQYGGIPDVQYWEWFDRVQGSVKLACAEEGNFVVNIKPHAKDSQRSLYVFDLVCAMVRQRGWLFVDEFCWLRTGIPQQVVHRFKNAFEPCYWFALSSDYRWYPQDVMHKSDSVPLALGAGAGDTNAARRQGKGGGAIQGNEIVSGKAYPSNVLDFKQNAEAIGHPAAFPVQLPSFFVACMTTDGGMVFDPFSGSGTTLIACERLGRRCRAVEISPAYCGVAIQRWVDMTGGEPVLLDA